MTNIPKHDSVFLHTLIFDKNRFTKLVLIFVDFHFNDFYFKIKTESKHIFEEGDGSNRSILSKKLGIIVYLIRVETKSFNTWEK